MTETDSAIAPTVATPARRLSGWLLEALVIAGIFFFAGLFSGLVPDLAALFIVVAILGYLAWLIYTGIHGQTPSKQILNTYIVREDGAVAGLGYVIVRELVIKGILFGILAAITLYIAWIVGALWCTWDANRQCLWDKVAGSRVVYAPDGIGQISSLPVTVGSPSRGAAPAQRAAENLQTLQDLHNRGLLTDDEYEERRAREMERL